MRIHWRLLRPAAILLLVGACHPLRPAASVTPALQPSASALPAPALAPTRSSGASSVLPRLPRAALTDSSADLSGVIAAVFGEPSVKRSADAPDALAAPSWDIEVRSYETHARVAHYIDLFSGSARERFLARLARGTRYEPMIRSKLKAGGLPEDMTFLALVESGYDPNAYSRAAAVGMWQFMSSTARGIGMRVDWWVDERRDPAASTDGAIRFLRDLQGQFGGSLYLAAAAYNGGPGRVARGLSRYADAMEGSEGEDRFFALAEQDYLRAETKDYVPQLIAAALVAKMPDKYGIRIDTLAPYGYDSVRVDGGTSLAIVSAASGATLAEIRDLNPSILRGVTPPDVKFWVKVPEGRGDTTSLALEAMPPSSRLGYTIHTVSGSKVTAVSLGKEFGVTSKEIGLLNPSLRTTKGGRLIAGQSVRIPAKDVMTFARDVPNPSIEIYGSSATKSLSAGGFHVVKRGETMGGIAAKHGLTVSRLKALNGMKGTKVVVGQTMRVSAAKSTAPKSTRSKSSSAKSSSAKSSSAKSSKAKAASAKAASAKAPAKAKTATKRKAGTKTAGGGKASSGKASSGKASSGKVSSGKASSGKAKSAKATSKQATTKKAPSAGKAPRP